MAPLIEDISVESSELKVYAALNRRQLKNDGLFICESLPAIESALESGIEAVSLLMEKRHALGKAAALIERLGDIPVYAPPDAEIKRLTGIELSRGVLCAMKRPRELTPEEALSGARRAAVLEDVRDDTNVGAIFRNAAALGVDALLLAKGCSDPLSRRSVRVSMGAVFRLPFAVIDELDAGGLTLLKQNGFSCCALALGENSVSVDKLRFAKTAFILGNEGDGLKESTIAQCDCCAVIPMSRGVDSLNVATAAAIAFYLARQ